MNNEINWVRKNCKFAQQVPQPFPLNTFRQPQVQPKLTLRAILQKYPNIGEWVNKLKQERFKNPDLDYNVNQYKKAISDFLKSKNIDVMTIPELAEILM